MPEGFRLDVKAYSLPAGHPTRPRSLWPDLRESLPESGRVGADGNLAAWEAYVRDVIDVFGPNPRAVATTMQAVPTCVPTLPISR